MKKIPLLLWVFLNVVLFNSICLGQVDIKSEKHSSTLQEGMESLSVPDEFNYENDSKISFRFSVEDDKHQPINRALVSFYGVTRQNKKDLFYSGATSINGLVDIQLKIPNHFEAVQIKVSKKGKEEFFEYPIRTSHGTKKYILK